MDKGLTNFQKKIGINFKNEKLLLKWFTHTSYDPVDNNEKLEVGRSFGHIAYRVKNIYKMCEKLMKEGVPINRPPRDGYMAFVKSPDNISIELLQDGEPLEPQEPWKSMPNIGEW